MRDFIQLQKDFISLRFGTFIHFNSATFQFHDSPVIDWEFDCENGGRPRRFPFDPKLWNPCELDCAQWAKTAKSAGCRFAALTAKHHEGFALWPTKMSEHCVGNASYKEDVVRAYLDAFRAEGIEAGLYFSVLDLTAGIGRGRCVEAQKAYIEGQIAELLTNYGSIPFIIIDGWSAPWGGPSYDLLPFAELDRLVKSIQPECLLMNIGCTDDINDTDILFFENAAGQEISDTFQGPGISCNKLTDTWFWRDSDSEADLKTPEWAVGKAEECFPRNINFMLNLSPNINGRLDENQVKAFGEIGQKLRLPGAVGTLPPGWRMR